jgi:hypothetical protein
LARAEGGPDGSGVGVSGTIVSVMTAGICVLPGVMLSAESWGNRPPFPVNKVSKAMIPTTTTPATAPPTMSARFLCLVVGSAGDNVLASATRAVAPPTVGVAPGVGEIVANSSSRYLGSFWAFSSACAKRVALLYRISGSVASERSTTLSRLSGISGLSSRGERAGSLQRLASMAKGVGASWGTVPVNIRYSMTPKA